MTQPDHAKTLAKIEAYAATLNGGVPGNLMMAIAQVSIQFLRWALTQGFEHKKTEVNNTVVMPFVNSTVVIGIVNPLVGKHPVGT